MIGYLIKKLLYGLAVIAGVVFLVFTLFTVLPDPSQLTRGQNSDSTTNANLRAELGLDESAPARFIMYLNDLSPVSIYHQSKNLESISGYTLFTTQQRVVLLKWPYLRRSYQNQKPVTEILSEAFTGTAVLALSAMLLAVLVGIPAGVFCAQNKNGFSDQLILFMANLGVSMPSFLVAILFAWVFGFLLHSATGLSMTGSLFDYHPFDGRVLQLKNLILPALSLGIRPLSIIAQLTRSSMLETLSLDYIRTAKAKGLSDRQVLIKHALRNALNPVVTAVSGWFASLLAGAFFIEYIFNWKGLGRITVEALEKSDFPVLMGAVLFISVLFVIINVLVDLLYALLDPRVRIN